jgi:phospholipid transport system transporter-binding protein
MSKPVFALAKQSDCYLVSGKLTYATVPFLWQQNHTVLVDHQPLIIFDLAGVTQSDSSGVALLIAWTRYFRHQSQAVRFIHLPSQMLSIIQLAGLESIIHR